MKNKKRLSLILVALIVFILLFLNTGNIPVFKNIAQMHKDSYWSNFWQVLAAILGVLGAIWISLHELGRQSDKAKTEQEKKDKEAKIEQEEKDKEAKIEQEEKDKIDAFSKLNALSKNINIELIPPLYELDVNNEVDMDKEKRYTLWVKILFYFVQINNVTAQIPKLLDGSDNNGDYDDFNDVILEIKRVYSQKENKPTADKILNTYNRFSIIEDTLKEDSGLNKDIWVLGHWILSKSYAENAKYLIGVSTKTKRVVRIFKLADNGVADYNEETGRILFKETDILYHDDEKTVNSNSLLLPELSSWTAMNPVLYFKSYLQKKNIEYGGELNKYIENYNELKNRDIIIVRTYKFGE